MVRATATIINPMGLHMRPAQYFIKVLAPFDCEVLLRANGVEMNGRSIMNLVAAGITAGTQIELECSGPEEEQALAAALQAIESGFQHESVLHDRK